MKTSEFMTLNWQDLAKGLVIAALTPVLVIIQQSVDAGSLTLNWKSIAMAAIAGGCAYLLKNLFTPAQVVTPAPGTGTVANPGQQPNK